MMMILEVAVTVVPLALLLYVYKTTHLYAYLAAASMFLFERLCAVGLGVYSNYFIPIEVGVLLWCLYYTIRCKDIPCIIATLIGIVIWVAYRMLMGTTPLGFGIYAFLPAIVVWQYRCSHRYRRHNPFKGDE